MTNKQQDKISVNFKEDKPRRSFRKEAEIEAYFEASQQEKDNEIVRAVVAKAESESEGESGDFKQLNSRV